MQHNIPPPELCVIAPDLAEKKRRIDEQNDYRLKLNRQVELVPLFNKIREIRENQDKRGGENKEPALVEHSYGNCDY